MDKHTGTLVLHAAEIAFRLRSGIKLALMAILALALSACAGNRFPIDSQGLDSHLPQQAEVSPGSEREHQRILAAYGGAYEDAKLEAFLDATVKRLVDASERPDLRFKITILNSPAVNAFALPSGQLYVTRGLLTLANDTSEVASVLSHEMAHVTSQHAAIRANHIRQVSINNRVVSEVLSDPQAGALALARSKLALVNFSRKQEFDADDIGVKIAAHAGYDPLGAARFLTSMGHNANLKIKGNAPRSLDFLSSHPATPERVKNARDTAREFAFIGKGERGKNTYLENLDGIVFGENPSDGFVRGYRFIHPKQGFAFTAPDGFTLEKTAHSVLGLNSDDTQALRFDNVEISPAQGLSDYLRSDWIENVETETIEEITINGLPAATATANGKQWSFRIYAIRIESIVYRFVFGAKNRTPAIDRAFRQSAASLHRLSPAEIGQIKPLRIKIVTVHPGDTAERLANRMSPMDKQIERFHVLNGLKPGEKIKPGDKVKIITFSPG